MAVRTGDPTLDEAIERFIDWGLRESTLHSRAAGAGGGCDDTVDQFIRSQLQRLPEGYSYEWVALLDPEVYDLSSYPGTHSFAAYGYADRGPGQPQHHLVEITTPAGDAFTVDFAAVQYGYLDFPLVQRRGADGSWTREADGIQWNAPQPPPLSGLSIGSRLPAATPESKRPLLGRVFGF